MKSAFTPKDVQNLINLSYRQLQYWDKTNFIKPSYRRKGKYRLYTFTDLIQLWVAKKMREKAISIQVLRKTIKDMRSLLPQVCHPMVDIKALVRGHEVLLFNGDLIMSHGFTEEYVYFDFSQLRDQIDDRWPEDIPAFAGPGPQIFRQKTS